MNDRRIKRMERQHERNKQPPFNVVSLMDIFTILVFFLLVNTNEITPLPNPKGIEMPESISEVSPKESVVVMLSNKAVRLQGVAPLTSPLRHVAVASRVTLAPPMGFHFIFNF